jgi:hypothetical protein
MALEAVLVTALLLAQLAVPSQLLEALGLDAVGDLKEAWLVVSHDECINDIITVRCTTLAALLCDGPAQETYLLWREEASASHGCSDDNIRSQLWWLLLI